MITTLLFDLGGVLYNLNPMRSQQALLSCGIDMGTTDFMTLDPSSPIDAFERGHLSKNDFLKRLQQKGKPGLSLEQCEQACCAILSGFTRARLEYLQQLKRDYKLYLLSNTNVLHIEYITEQLQQQFDGMGWNDIFVRTFLSYELGLRKPEVDIYKRVIDVATLNPEETLFIDDLKANTDAAAQCGLQVLHKPATLELCEALPLVLDELNHRE